MTRRKRPADVDPYGYEIRVGMSSAFIVVLASATHDYDPVQAFHSLAEAVAHFPSAIVTEGAQRKARENGEV
jgi:hypothetical protein